MEEVEEVNRIQNAADIGKSFLIVLSIILLGPIGLIMVWIWRREWLKKFGVATIMITWSVLYIVGMMNSPKDETPAMSVNATEADTIHYDGHPISEESNENEPEENHEQESESVMLVTEEDSQPTPTVTEDAPAETYTPHSDVPTRPTENSTSSPNSTYTSSPADTNANENTQLPLKAICMDGAIAYQDNPELPNYRGMCSSHGGIKEKLGRVE